jgi:hypothetical protein
VTALVIGGLAGPTIPVLAAGTPTDGPSLKWHFARRFYRRRGVGVPPGEAESTGYGTKFVDGTLVTAVWLGRRFRLFRRYANEAASLIGRLFKKSGSILAGLESFEQRLDDGAHVAGGVGGGGAGNDGGVAIEGFLESLGAAGSV